MFALFCVTVIRWSFRLEGFNGLESSLGVRMILFVFSVCMILTSKVGVNYHY